MPDCSGTDAKKILIARELRLGDYLAVIAATTIWGGSFAATKIALAQSSPVMILWIRFIIAIPVLMLGAKIQKAMRLPSKHELLPLLLMGFQGIFFHQGIQAYAMKTAGAANANWVMVASPALVAALGRIFLKEKITGHGIAGLMLSAIGVMLVLSYGTVSNAAFAGFGSVGDLILLGSVLNWAVFSIISRRFLLKDVPSSFAILWEMIFSLICATIFLLLTGADFSKIAAYSAVTWKALVFLGVLSSATAYMFWFHGLSKLPAARVVIFQFLQPLVGIIISYLLLGERFTVWIFTGGALIAGGIYLVNKK